MSDQADAGELGTTQADSSGAASSSTVTADGSTTGSPSESSSGTAGVVDDETYCLQLGEGNCGGQTPNGLPCSLETFADVSVVDGMCMYGDYTATRCVALSGDTTGGGCSVPEACEEVGGMPFYREVDGGMLMGIYCGGSPPLGWTECESVDPATAEPAECGCMCNGTAASSSGSTTGDGSTGTGTGGGSSSTG